MSKAEAGNLEKIWDERYRERKYWSDVMKSHGDAALFSDRMDYRAPDLHHSTSTHHTHISATNKSKHVSFAEPLCTYSAGESKRTASFFDAPSVSSAGESKRTASFFDAPSVSSAGESKRTASFFDAPSVSSAGSDSEHRYSTMTVDRKIDEMARSIKNPDILRIFCSMHNLSMYDYL